MVSTKQNPKLPERTVQEWVDKGLGNKPDMKECRAE